MSALSPAPTSSWIAFHGYSNGTMTLITKTGESYAATIPESRYSEFLKAPSQGAFFNMYIKPFAVISKVDVTQDVALVEAAKDRIAMEAKFSKALDVLEAAQAAGTVNSRTYKVPRKAPAKTLLPHKPAPKGASDAWIDFRCIADPTTGPGLVKALKRFIELKGKDRENYAHYIPYMGYGAPAGQVEIAALGDWGRGYVNPKYLKAFPKGVTNPKALANAYRSAYRSWVRREAAKKAKAKAASGPVESVAYAFVPSNPVVQVVTVPVGVDQKRVDQALEVLDGLEAGKFRVNASAGGSELGVAVPSRMGVGTYYTWFNMAKNY